MSNSNLVTYTRISPNRTSPRNKPITKITIHHMAGNLTLEQCGNIFANSGRPVRTMASTARGILANLWTSGTAPGAAPTPTTTMWP